MYRFQKVLSGIRIYGRKSGIKIESDRPLLNTEDNLYTDAIKMWWNENSKQIVERVRR